MAHPLHHAISSAKRFGGIPEDYQEIHDWFDCTKAHEPSFRHRALRHHSLGIFQCEEQFGTFIVNSDGKKVPVRVIGEQHVKEDFNGYIPTVHDWLKSIREEQWMQPSPAYARQLADFVNNPETKPAEWPAVPV